MKTCNCCSVQTKSGINDCKFDQCLSSNLSILTCSIVCIHYLTLVWFNKQSLLNREINRQSETTRSRDILNKTDCNVAIKPPGCITIIPQLYTPEDAEKSSIDSLKIVSGCCHVCASPYYILLVKVQEKTKQFIEKIVYEHLNESFLIMASIINP